MKIILPEVYALSIKVDPLLGWDEGGGSFSKKNKASQYETIEQVESSDSSNKHF